MKRNLLNFTVTLILGMVLSQFLPWWSVMIAGFVASFSITLKKAAVFFVPFFAILVFWSFYGLVLSSNNNFILAKRIASLLYLNGNPYLLVLVTGIIGGLAAGIAAILGKQLKTLNQTR